ncbi:helix-turn-helix transcriptional regulator [Methylobacterium sp. J-070]|uniref:helix-turn-helix transcriptional regulator n=1 Tax=Methylobacterium sp. J-070 TaxID=2836650 RepID=UPI001FBA987C|nr:XRE family transcriptional regulator [Methylobacterium sp. J-070]MCJ2051197.1 helix-turn-helix domain-containing protein [Methylobacterium sp. J-070]
MAQTLGSVLRERRKSRGLTQQAIAASLGVTRAAVGQWEAGTHEPSTDNLIAVCRLLDLDVSRAVEGEISGAFADAFHEVQRRLAPVKENFERNDTIGAFDLIKKELENVVSNGPLADAAKIPFFLTQAADEDFDFLIIQPNFAEAPRPSKLVGKNEAYCFRVYGDKLYPKYECGALAYADPASLPQLNDYVLLRTTMNKTFYGADNKRELIANVCIMGRYVGDTATSIDILQHNPSNILRLSVNEGTRIDRICDPTELVAY